jgi:hypothetical protein
VRIQTEPHEDSRHHEVADEGNGTASKDRTMCSQALAESISEATRAQFQDPRGRAHGRDYAPG